MDIEKFKLVVCDITDKIKDAAFMGDYQLAELLLDRLCRLVRKRGEFEDEIKTIYRYK